MTDVVPDWAKAPAPDWASAPAPDWATKPLPYTPDEAARLQSQGVPLNPARMAPVAAPPEPSIGSKVVGGVQAGLLAAKDTINSIGGYFGTLAGGVGGMLGAAKVAMTGGVQPDDPRVLAVTGDNRPREYDNDMVAHPVTALGEAAQQGAQTAIDALNSGAQIPLNNPNAPGYAKTIEEGLQTFANAFPTGPTPEMNAAVASLPAAVTMARNSRAAKAVGAAVGEAGEAVKNAPGAAAEAVKSGTAKGIAKVMGTPDPELVKTAQLADQFPNKMTVPPDRLYQPGTAKTVGQDLNQVTAGGGHALEAANKEAFTKNLVDLIDPGSDAARLTPEVLDAALDKSGAVIGDIARKTELPASELGGAFESLARDAQRTGAGDVPRIIPNLIEDLLEKADADGKISGDAFQNWDSNLGMRIRRTGDSELAGALSDLQEAGRDILEKQVAVTDPAQVQALADARRQYAYGKLVAPDVAKTIDGLVQPGSLMQSVARTRSGKGYMAANAGGPIGDLAKVGKLLDNTTKGAQHVVGNGTVHSLLGPVRAAAGQVYNRAAPRVSRILAPAAEAAEEAAPAEAAKPLLLEYRPSLQSDAIPVTPEGQALPGAQPDVRENMQTSQRVAQGQGGTGTPPLATSFADYDLSAPEFQPPRTAAPAQAAPSELRALDQENFPAAPSRGAREVPEPSFPHDIAEPDTARTMVSGRPGETAATDAAGQAMHEPGAVAARAAQAKAAEDATTAAHATEAAKPKPNTAEQARLDEIDKAIGGTQSDIVRETLEKERARVMKDVAARDAAEKAKAAAAELRQQAQNMTDATTKKAMLQRADKLDPPAPAPAPKAKPAEDPLPRISYVDDAEWRKVHGITTDGDAQRALRTREAFDLNPKAVETAAAQHDQNPRAFDRAVDQIIEKGAPNADAVQPAAQGSQGPAGQPDVVPGAADAAGQRARADGDAATGADGAAPTAGGQAAQGPVDEAAARARFDLKHPRADDGKFVEAPEISVAKIESRRDNQFRRPEDGPTYPHARVTLSNGDVYHLTKLNSTESMGVPGWHLDEKVGAAGDQPGVPAISYLADTREAAITALVRKLNESRKKAKE